MTNQSWMLTILWIIWLACLLQVSHLIVRGQDPVELLVGGAPLRVSDVVAGAGDAPVPLLGVTAGTGGRPGHQHTVIGWNAVRGKNDEWLTFAIQCLFSLLIEYSAGKRRLLTRRNTFSYSNVTSLLITSLEYLATNTDLFWENLGRFIKVLIIML